jgi:hypothetical protein
MVLGLSLLQRDLLKISARAFPCSSYNPSVDGTKLVLAMVGGAVVLVLVFQALNQFT